MIGDMQCRNCVQKSLPEQSESLENIPISSSGFKFPLDSNKDEEIGQIPKLTSTAVFDRSAPKTFVSGWKHWTNLNIAEICHGHGDGIFMVNQPSSPALLKDLESFPLSTMTNTIDFLENGDVITGEQKPQHSPQLTISDDEETKIEQPSEPPPSPCKKVSRRWGLFRRQPWKAKAEHSEQMVIEQDCASKVKPRRRSPTLAAFLLICIMAIVFLTVLMCFKLQQENELLEIRLAHLEKRLGTGITPAIEQMVDQKILLALMTIRGDQCRAIANNCAWNFVTTTPLALVRLEQS